MSTSTTGSDDEFRRYALGLWIAVWGSFAVSIVTFSLDPMAFYSRSGEYTIDILVKKPTLLLSSGSCWNKAEKGLVSFDYFLRYQETRPTIVSLEDNNFRRGGLPRPYAAIVIGDSFALGSGGLTDDDTFPAQLSRRLGQGVANATMNPGAIGQHTDDATTILEVFEYGHITPQALETLFDQPKVELGSPFFQVVPLERYYFPAIIGRTARKLFDDVRVTLRIGFRELDQPLNPHLLRTSLTDGDRTKMAAVLAARAEQFRSAGFDYILVLVPRFIIMLAEDVDDYTLFYHTRLVDQLVGRGVHAIDLLKPFREKGGASLYWRVDGHWNEKGVSVAADVVSAYMREHNLPRDLTARSRVTPRTAAGGDVMPAPIRKQASAPPACGP